MRDREPNTEARKIIAEVQEGNLASFNMLIERSKSPSEAVRGAVLANAWRFCELGYMPDYTPLWEGLKYDEDKYMADRILDFIKVGIPDESNSVELLDGRDRWGKSTAKHLLDIGRRCHYFIPGIEERLDSDVYERRGASIRDVMAEIYYSTMPPHMVMSFLSWAEKEGIIGEGSAQSIWGDYRGIGRACVTRIFKNVQEVISVF